MRSNLLIARKSQSAQNLVASQQQVIWVRRIVLLGLLVCVSIAQADSSENARLLPLPQAHEIALRNHPRISEADLRVLAARQVVREMRAGFFPNISGSVVAVGTADSNTRLAASGGLNNSSIFERNAEGVTISQLITDFGRTQNLTRSAGLRAQAEENNAQATREEILLEVDAAYFAALQAQSVARVASQTVATRQSFLDQVTALASNKLKSELDLSFAQVNVEEARLLLSRASNDLAAAFSQLTALMAEKNPVNYQLVEEPIPDDVPTNIAGLVEVALATRPQLQRLRNETEAAQKFARAEKALRYPTVSAIGSAGVLPIHDSQLPDNYAAAGVGLNLPLFTGGLFTARQREAELRARAAEAGLRNEENNVIRDVHIAWLNAENSFDRLRITRALVEHAKRAFELAQARYENQSSSIVELNQAQLNEIQAEIAFADTQYEYMLRRSALSFQTGTLR